MVFPQPDGPRIAHVSPRQISSEKPSNSGEKLEYEKLIELRLIMLLTQCHSPEGTPLRDGVSEAKNLYIILEALRGARRHEG